MMKTITTILGVLLCALAVIGFLNNNFMGMVLNPLHDVLLLVAGGAALYYGLKGTEFQARYCCRVLGVIFGLLAVAGFIAGPGTPTAVAGIERTNDLLPILRGNLEFSTADSWANAIFGLIGLVAGFFPREQEIKIDMAAAEQKQKVGTGS